MKTLLFFIVYKKIKFFSKKQLTKENKGAKIKNVDSEKELTKRTQKII